ncbi:MULTISPECIES: hypothetical protein [unclassified Bartonella]|uniref:hypothetical protein n=1 Tax=unclassified Bartonella TaxID=2645622 RepID=UPI0035D0A478
MGLRALRNISLKQVCELAMQIYSVWGVLSLREECDSIKERDKQKREAMGNLHYKILLRLPLKS